MNEYNSVIGLREPTISSGVGLFNRTLSLRLGVPHRLFDEYQYIDGDHPLFSLKFGELTSRQRRRMVSELVTCEKERPYTLFLHALDHSTEELRTIEHAKRVYCGNDSIYRILRAAAPHANLLRSFSPGHITPQHQAVCRPATINAFTFGMAGKIDRARLVRLQELMTTIDCDFRLFCSFAVHQTSDGSCLPEAVKFLSSVFGDMFVNLGTLSDHGVAYFLNTCPIFVGFYADGVRANNSTFVTAIDFQRKIITNLDEFSPPEVADAPQILNIDQAGPDDLRAFLDRDVTERTLHQPFTWENLVNDLTGRVQNDVPRVRAA